VSFKLDARGRQVCWVKPVNAMAAE
jgi:hypothetical protein